MILFLIPLWVFSLFHQEKHLSPLYRKLWRLFKNICVNESLQYISIYDLLAA